MLFLIMENNNKIKNIQKLLSGRFGNKYSVDEISYIFNTKPQETKEMIMVIREKIEEELCKYEVDFDLEDSEGTLRDILNAKLVDKLDNKDLYGYSDTDYSVLSFYYNMLTMFKVKKKDFSISVFKKDIPYSQLREKIIKKLIPLANDFNYKNIEESSWSPRAIVLTENMLEDLIKQNKPAFSVKSNDKSNSYGIINYEIDVKKLLILGYESGEMLYFDSIDEVIDAGWVAD